jgi:alkanesulfonate monooxygenase SsuD/methylene tetrahydromethanopterin reductase-like flavin-dependent oxidoreductase (luciferase family)/putative sterol carrier protein
VRFSLAYEHQLPQPWGAGAEHRLLKEAVEQVRLADRLGYHAVWAVEHHFLEEASHSSAPAVFLAACSQVTKTIRLGLAGVPVPPGYHHPATVAATAATLDLLSDGRVELATAETATGAELGGFGIDRAGRRAQWIEAQQLVARMLVEEPFAGIAGPTLTMPPRNVVPKPLQQPHPPLWMAGTRREVVQLAAEHGVGALDLAFLEAEDAADAVADYDAILASERCVPAGFAVNANVAVALPMMVHASEREAIARGLDGAHFLAYARASYDAFGEHRPGHTTLWDEFLSRREDAGFARSIIVAEHAPLSVKVLHGGLASLRGAIGTPDQLLELLRRYEDAGVDEIVLCVQTGRTEHGHVLEALQLFADAVMPEFAQRQGARDEAKRERLGEAPQRALARRPPHQTPASDYTFRADDGGTPAPAPAPTPAAAESPPATPAPGATAPPAPSLAERTAALRRAAEAQGERALHSFVARANDRRLERTIGSRLGLKLVFAAMARQFVPERAAGFTGDIQYDLRDADGEQRSWTVSLGTQSATARPGPSSDPQLKLTLDLADFVRIAGRDLDPVKAVLTGRLELAGDFAVAMRLGEMFGQPASL